MRGALQWAPPLSQRLPVASACTRSHAGCDSLGADYSITVILQKVLYAVTLDSPPWWRKRHRQDSCRSRSRFSLLRFCRLLSALTGRLAFFISPPSQHRPFSILLILLQKRPPLFFFSFYVILLPCLPNLLHSTLVSQGREEGRRGQRQKIKMKAKREKQMGKQIRALSKAASSILAVVSHTVAGTSAADTGGGIRGPKSCVCVCGLITQQAV